MLNGFPLANSKLNADLAAYLIAEGAIRPVYRGETCSLRLSNPEIFRHCLLEINEALTNFDYLRETLREEKSRNRYDLVHNLGNSKSLKSSACNGFMVNTYYHVECTLSGAPLILSATPGSFVYIHDWEHFKIPSDTLIVGVENMENFRLIDRHGDLFEQELKGYENDILFVARYPQSKALRSWLKLIPNRYVHFGDFDLAGISIFLNEIQCYIPGRSSFLIPKDIKERLKCGSSERYDKQYRQYRYLSTNIEPLQSLIWLIRDARRGYDQEGYILPDPTLSN